LRPDLTFGFTYLVAAAIYVLVNVLAVGERARSFKVISPGLLPPLGIIFALFVAFTASATTPAGYDALTLARPPREAKLM
jgi:hypothetical protein